LNDLFLIFEENDLSNFTDNNSLSAFGHTLDTVINSLQDFRFPSDKGADIECYNNKTKAFY